MQEQLIIFETAKLAKEKGFDWKCLFMVSFKYHGETPLECEWENWNKTPHLISLPTQSLLQKWLREVHNIHIMIEPYYNKNKDLVYGFDLLLQEIEEEDIFEDGFKTYEEALEIGLKEGLKLIK